MGAGMRLMDGRMKRRRRKAIINTVKTAVREDIIVGTWVW